MRHFFLFIAAVALALVASSGTSWAPTIITRGTLSAGGFGFAPATGTTTVTKVVYLTTTGANTWTVPSDWNNANNTIEVIGGGGNGGAPGGCGGGGGGAYSISTNVALTPGNTAYYQVGAAATDTWFNGGANSPPTLASQGALAKAGQNASGPTAGAGGLNTSGVGTVTYSGGNGGNGLGSSSGAGGGGGGAGGPNGKGGTGGTDDPSVLYNDGGGGGGDGGGSSGAAGASGVGGTGGNNYLASGGGAQGVAGTNGGGGGGGGGKNSGSNGGNGSTGTEWNASHGSGSGGGGGAYASTGYNGGTGGLYGGGGGGNGAGTHQGAAGPGVQGIIVITYLGSAAAPTAPCSGGTVTWGACSGTVPALSSGAQTGVGNAAGGHTGSVTETCNNGTLAKRERVAPNPKFLTPH